MYRAVVFTTVALFYANAYQVEVKVKQGTLLGARGSTVFEGRLYYAFYGIPYARAPVGARRFHDPEPPLLWKYPYDASTEYHGACAQAHIIQKHGLYGVEDCLLLNVYTPSLPKQSSTLKTVIVWIHGYAFSSSFGHIHGPDFLIDKDVVFVSVTHRIGVFGFLKLNQTDTHANMGLKDIVMALKWIRGNIKYFGGDKNKITVMACGSAASYISLLWTTKYNKFFSKIILQSGSIFAPPLFQGDPKIEFTRLRANLRKKGLKNIRNASTKDIVESSRRIYTSSELINSQKPLIPFLPILEIKSNHSLLSEDPLEIRDGVLKLINGNKPILIGFNSEESISEVIPFLHNPHYLTAIANPYFKFMVPFITRCKFNYSSQIYKEIGDQIKTGYFRHGVSENSTTNFLRYASDLIKYPIYNFIRQYLKIRAGGMYVYKFSYNGLFNAMKATSTADLKLKVGGASTGDEICYILKCEPILENYLQVRRDENHRDRIFIRQIAELWVNFAKTGDPTPKSYQGNVTWPLMTIKKDNVLHIGKATRVGDSTPEKRMSTFWNGIYRNYYEHCRSARDEL